MEVLLALEYPMVWLNSGQNDMERNSTHSISQGRHDPPFYSLECRPDVWSRSVILGQGSHNVGQAGQRSKTKLESLTLFSQTLLVTVELLNDWSLEGHPNSLQRRPKAPEKGTRDLDTLYTKKSLRGSNIGATCDSPGWEVTVALSDWFYQFFPHVPEPLFY